MGSLAFEVLSILYTAIFFLFTYTFVIADPKTSRLAYIFQNTIPHSIVFYVERTLGKNASTKLEKWHHYLLYEQNPALLIVYICLVVGSWCIVFIYGFPLIIRSNHVSSNHVLSGLLTFILCFKSWSMAYHTKPGYINQSNLQKYDNYPYDNILFCKNNICPTTNIRKVARSKYDVVTSKHVSRFDHYCGWINQPIGEENYKYFLFFLFIHVIMCWYGTILFTLVLQGEILRLDLYNSKFLNSKTNQVIPATTSVIMQFLFYRYFFIVSVLLLMTTMGILLTLFLAFHIYITSYGMTTNEFYKWRNVRSWYKKCCKHWKSAKDKGDEVSTCKEKNIVWNFSFGSLHHYSSTITTEKQDVAVNNDTNSSSENDNSSKTTKTTIKTLNLPAKDVLYVLENEKLILLHPGAMPENRYDCGFVNNWKDVLFPRSLQRIDLDEMKKND